MPAVPPRPAPATALSLWAASSHDLRQPLHGLKLLTGLLAGEDDADARDKLAAKMAAGLLALQTMIDNLSELATLEAGGSQPPLAPCTVDALLADIAAELHPAAAHGHGSLATRASSLTVSSNSRWLRETVRSLVIYALWVDPAARIVVGAHRAATHTVVEVNSSTPLTLQPARSARHFTELPMTLNDAPTLAIGLGMPLLDYVTRHLGATIEISALPAGGTSYTLKLP